MAYNSNVPNSTDRINTTQQPIKDNFVQIETSFEANHIDLNAGANTGKHKFVQMPEQGAAPATALNEGALYTKESSSSGTPQTELFFRRENNGTEIEVSGALAAAIGWTLLPSGILIKWGNATTDGAGNITVNMNASGQAFATAYIVTITPRSTGNFSYSASVLGGTSISGSISGSNIDFYWYAIGSAA